MKRILLYFIIVTVTYGLCGCEKLFPAKNKGLKEMEKIETRWDDALKIASATPRLTLGSQVANLQAIKRDLREIEVGECPVIPDPSIRAVN